MLIQLTPVRWLCLKKGYRDTPKSAGLLIMFLIKMDMLELSHFQTRPHDSSGSLLRNATLNLAALASAASLG
jgi:hypothetical protein